MRALVIDDSATMRRILAAWVTEAGGEAVPACDGLEALAVLGRDGPFDVAFVDWDMPRLDGPGFVRRVREEPAHAGLRLVMVTAHVGMDDIARALALGADDYLMKPLTAEVLLDRLRSLGLAA